MEAMALTMMASFKSTSSCVRIRNIRLEIPDQTSNCWERRECREGEWSSGRRTVTDSKEGEWSPVRRKAKGRRFKGMRRVTEKLNGRR